MFVEIFPRPRVCCLIFLFTLLAGAFPSPGVAANSFDPFDPSYYSSTVRPITTFEVAPIKPNKSSFNTAGGTITNNNDASTNTTNNNSGTTTDGGTTTNNNDASTNTTNNNLDHSLDQAEAELLSIVAALEDPAKNNLDQQAVNRALQSVGDNILQHSNAATATVAGNLINASSVNEGSFGFQVNLSSGNISNARMSGTDLGNHWGGGSFDLSGGTGKLSGNDFSVDGLTGNVINKGGGVLGPAVGSLSGTATDGFQNLNNNSISNGKYAVTQPGGTPITGGTISGGRIN